MTDDLFQRYAGKIVPSIEHLVELVGNFPRSASVVMCHGVFDVVHPGHLRHLSYAKSQADLLVVSITADEHITKGTYRPHVPEELRAVNLAALDMVDFVLIDRNKDALANIHQLRPDFFAKGFEYTSSGLHPATAQEAEVLASYGGQIIFTPGDVVYSSSKLLSESAPSLSAEKLELVLKLGNLTKEQVIKMASELKDIRVHVVGDVIVDRVMHTKIIGGQVKTPTISVKSVGEDQFAGGAAVVAKTLAGSGSSVVLSSVLGKDERADFVATELLNSSVFLNGIIEDGRPTTLKLAVTAEGHRLLKIDTLDNSPVIGRSLQALVEAIKTVPADVVVFSDFRHGVFSHASLGVLREAIPENCFTAADSQVASRWGNILDFQGFHLITPNEREARFALGDQDSTVGSLARKLKAESACDTLMMKLGERGLICLYNESTSVAGANFALDSMAKAVLDPVGAGDAFLAYCTLVLYKFGSPHAAAIIGSAAAAASCETDGNEAVTLERVCDVLRRAFLMKEYSIA